MLILQYEQCKKQCLHNQVVIVIQSDDRRNKEEIYFVLRIRFTSLSNQPVLSKSVLLKFLRSDKLLYSFLPDSKVNFFQKCLLLKRIPFANKMFES